MKIQEKKTDPQMAGIQLAHAMKWEGKLIFLAALAALEESNFHRVSRELIRAWESMEGPINE